jgi:hypothetical protein
LKKLLHKGKTINLNIVLAESWATIGPSNEAPTLVHCWANIYILMSKISEWHLRSVVGPMLAQTQLPTQLCQSTANVGPMSACYLGIHSNLVMINTHISIYDNKVPFLIPALGLEPLLFLHYRPWRILQIPFIIKWFCQSPAVQTKAIICTILQLWSQLDSNHKTCIYKNHNPWEIGQGL